MLLEFFMERTRIEPANNGASFRGCVPDLPEIYVEGATEEECLNRLTEAISSLLALEAGRRSTDFASEMTGKTALNTNPNQAGLPAEQSNAHTAEASFRFSEILYEKRDWIARVTINRPEVYNTYTSTTLKEMAWAFRDAALDDHVAVLVLTGAGDRAFCAGSDVKQHGEELADRPEKIRDWMQALVEAHEALRQSGKPSIARINGIVAGGGNEWNLACDLAIAADHAKFVLIETKVGLVAASGATQWLPLVIGERRAREILLTGEPISANKALLWGLVNDVVPYRELDRAVDALCQKLIEKFPESLKYTRQQLGFWKDFVWESTIQEARDWIATHLSSEEVIEGMRGLTERREIDYRAFRSRLSTQNEKNEKAAASRTSNTSTRPGQRPRQKPDERSKAASSPETGSVSGRLCFSCGAQGLPASFEYCGRCGARLT